MTKDYIEVDMGKGEWVAYPEEVQETFRKASGGSSFKYDVWADDAWSYTIEKFDTFQEEDSPLARVYVLASAPLQVSPRASYGVAAAASPM